MALGMNGVGLPMPLLSNNFYNPLGDSRFVRVAFAPAKRLRQLYLNFYHETRSYF